MTQQPPVSEVIDPALRRFREYAAAGIAGIVVAGTVIIMIVAFIHVGSPELFSRVKDLLLIIDPMLGVVIGYYFNKVSTEARAENAETTAKTAAITAQQAIEANNTAVSEANAANVQVQDTKTVLKEVTQAAEGILAQRPRAAVGTLGPGETAADEAWLTLRAAVIRAKRIQE